MTERKINGQSVIEPGTVATEWTPSPLDYAETIENAD